MARVGYAIEAEGLVKRYRSVVALDKFGIEVEEGTVLGLLGPNGAGKTTAVRVFTTLVEPDAGWARVAGLDVRKDSSRLRELIGLSGQYAAVDDDLTGFENLDLVGRLYHLGRTESRRRARELLEQFGLAKDGNRTVKGYSGGMRRRLDLAGALVARPRVLFLDEPTTGLDPVGRLDVWATISQLVAEGSTLLLTTQYMEEADRLANRISVINDGRVIADGTPEQLKLQVGGERLELTLTSADEVAAARAAVLPMATGEPSVDEAQSTVTVPVDGGSQSLMDAVRRLDGSGVRLVDVRLRRPTLDDVFLVLTGHSADGAERTTEAAT